MLEPKENSSLLTPDYATTIKAKLSPQELQQAATYAASLQVERQNTVLTYGKTAQQELSNLNNNVLAQVKSKDLGEIGTSLHNLVNSLNEADPDKLTAPRLLRFFTKLRTSIFEMTAKYQEVSSQIERAASQLETQEQTLLDDNDLLDQMYAANMDFYQKLNVLIVGAQLKSAELATELTKLQKNSAATDQMTAQHIQDIIALQDRLSKRSADLFLTREITIQQAPQIRLIQNTNAILAEKIQSSLTTAIPLWKNQVMITLTLLNQKNAVTAQNAVADATNDLLKKNSTLLKQSTLDVAQASQRGVVDIATLRETQANLLQTIEEALKIQQDGHNKRQALEQDLQTMEQELQTKLSATPDNKR
ncbi:toxic anion resistance protein [Loigolactobacillus binensis]|uniref:Toxic anion resistance protein n=1 Tax=Loigolactobacillus binensis TaxID=2559922 RepID=A0ABW3E8I6_9LACO|nr:toxic anion resistance protein [Loigolactobacillus binensis]